MHPRFGVVDVVPFVALDPEARIDARRAARRDRPVDQRDLRRPGLSLRSRSAAATEPCPTCDDTPFAASTPDFGPDAALTRRSAPVAVGARAVLVAWNLWLAGVSRDETRAIAKAVRRPEVRSLAFRAG